MPRTEIIKRKAITYLSTIVLLGISFLIYYGLSLAELNNKLMILSIIKTIILSSFNRIISSRKYFILVAIKKLTLYEKHFTMTQCQTSIAGKSIIAYLLNSILIPFLISFYIAADVYPGLTNNIFTLGLANSLSLPIKKIINSSYLSSRIKKYLASSPCNKFIYLASRLSLSQK